MNIKANDPNLTSWVGVSQDSHFPIQNLPFGIFETQYLSPGAGIAIGEMIIDLTYLNNNGFFDDLGLPKGIFNQPTLNDFFRLGKKRVREVRGRVSQLLRHDNPELRDKKIAVEMALIDQAEANMLMPVYVQNYTDFYSSIEHATNVGKMFRDPENALLPNWRHIPVGYHGRASSIMVSGTPIHRPKGQTKAPDQESPVFGPTKRLDFELEMAFITVGDTILGESIVIEDAEDHIVGMVLFNDWSARDVQVWEYVPLGPFLAKNFASAISPWVVTLDALEPFRTEGPKQEPDVLPYLQFEGKRNFDIHLQAMIKPDGGDMEVVSNTNFKYMYWNMAQQLAHHSVNGCNIETGDMYASGTISGPNAGSFGSMLELAWKGTRPIKLSNGEERKFIHDLDTVVLSGYAQGNAFKIGFGEVSNQVLPTK